MFGWKSASQRDLEERVKELEEAWERVTALEADWQDWLHKIRNVLARLNQRARDDEERAPAAPRERPMSEGARRLLYGHHNGEGA